MPRSVICLGLSDVLTLGLSVLLGLGCGRVATNESPMAGGGQAPDATADASSGGSSAGTGGEVSDAAVDGDAGRGGSTPDGGPDASDPDAGDGGPCMGIMPTCEPGETFCTTTGALAECDECGTALEGTEECTRLLTSDQVASHSRGESLFAPEGHFVDLTLTGLAACALTRAGQVQCWQGETMLEVPPGW